MIFYKDQIINPEKFRQPSFFISPFRTSDLGENKTIIEKNNFTEEVYKKNNLIFGTKHEYFLSGKEAINKALSHYKFDKEDEILILTTTSNSYISSCVTREIEKFCGWSREKTDKTKLIFIIHEFGKIYTDLKKVISYGLPIIEDCAMSLFSNNEEGLVGQYGDFTIYSIPKFFPIQFGGILRVNCENYNINDDKPYKDYIKNLTFHYLQDEKKIRLKRKENNDYLISKLENLGFRSYFNYNNNETPSVCMFENNGYDLPELKIFLQKNGVECSIFYGKDVFFIPTHQNLKTFELDFMINLIDFFIHEN